MRKARNRLGTILTVALVLLLGNTMPALASVLCTTPACPRSVDLEQKSCCPEAGAIPHRADACCCSLEAAPDPFAKPSAPVAWQAEQHAMALFQAPLPMHSCVAADSDRVASYSGLPPPDPADEHVRGRAPPVA